MAMPSGLRISDPMAGTKRKRNAGQQRSHRCHHDGAKAQQAGIVNGVGRIFPVLPLPFEREVDHHNSIFLHNTDQQNDPDDGHHAERLPEEESAPAALLRQPRVASKEW